MYISCAKRKMLARAHLTIVFDQTLGAHKLDRGIIAFARLFFRLQSNGKMTHGIGAGEVANKHIL